MRSVFALLKAADLVEPSCRANDDERTVWHHVRPHYQHGLTLPPEPAIFIA
ncbi:hypothetical protein [Burkholderia sp. IMCC1007]|uniref:hypothetical protein n=1 Tax=Burkholderia sp. IMCC1007 TaxID=3004104 RepID=UPI0022B482A3|nr:hypothetical protein [Burkholderia sp. IMCC1007]